MGDANTLLTPAHTRHLLKRTGLGLTKRDQRTITQRPKARGKVADKLLKFRPRGVRFKAEEFNDAVDEWLLSLVQTKTPLLEKLVLFWHDHFSTAFDKVGSTGLMIQQNTRLHENAKGNFKTFVKAMNRDPAMMEFLDTVRNRRQRPNENYAREVQELFTLGVKDFAGNDNYTQDDIVQIARAFTGWRYESPEVHGERDASRARAIFDENRHDFMEQYPERGPKVIFTTTGGFGPGGRSFAANGEGAAEIDTVVDIIFEHRDTDGKNTVARRTASRLFEYFAHASPDVAVVDEVVAAARFDTTWDLQALLRAILVHDAFYATAAPAPFDGATLKSVKWPIDFVVGTLRTLRMKMVIDKERGLRVEGGSRSRLRTHLESMGQELMNPPSVFGWDWETAWLSSSTLLAHYLFARDVAAARDRGKNVFDVRKVINLRLSDPDAIVDAVTDLLGISDQLTPAERAVLVDYLTDGGTVTSFDFKHDDEARDGKLYGLFALAMQSPAYQVH
jgi:uncharacterized protein (DUF1800 family)